MSSRIKRASGLGDMEEAMGLDEVVAVGCDFHIERLSDGSFWFSVRAGGKDLAVWMTADKRGFITAHHEWRQPGADGAQHVAALETEPCPCTNNKYGEFDGDCKLCGGTGRLPATPGDQQEKS